MYLVGMLNTYHYAGRIQKSCGCLEMSERFCERFLAQILRPNFTLDIIKYTISEILAGYRLHL
jgi:hypothetical protein